jgi:hypothetical protein
MLITPPARVPSARGTALSPRRRGSAIHGVVFTSIPEVHSGVDDEHGHFRLQHRDRREFRVPRLRGVERAEHAVAQLALGRWAKALVTEDALA